MIEFKNVSKQFNGRYVLKNINMSLPRYGLVIINGPSGCGKTTLLNVLSTLLDFEGDVVFDGKSISKINDIEKEIIRNQKIGFVFQDYKLFEFESVKENIGLAIDLTFGDKKNKKSKRIKDLLRVVNLARKENELVSHLSGGEKQRVAIARAISNSPSVILADEPTGNLDVYNSEIVMELLQKISSSSLVVMVTHDQDITKKYADEIIYMRDGKIKKICYQNKKKHHEYLPVLSLENKTKSRLLPFSFLAKHTLSSVKRRKWRTLFMTMVTSLGLIGIGLASTLSSIISSNMNRSYSAIIDDDRLIMSNKEIPQGYDIIKAVDYDFVNELYEDNKKDINYAGVYYANDFDRMFTDNYATLDTSGEVKPLPGLSIKYINEFSLLNNGLEILPSKISFLENNEFVLSAPFALVNELCFQLKIERTLESFSRYIERNELFINFAVANSNWSYTGDFSLKLKGFILSSQTLIYHSNPLWNEYILENKLTLSITDYLNINSEHPWDLKKAFYLDFKQNRDTFLRNHRFAFEYQDIDFEILDKKYYPNLCANIDSYDCSRLLVINRSKKDYIPSFIGEFCKESSNYVKSVIYGSNNAYAIYDKSLMVGFAKNCYLSSDETNIEDVIDLLSYVKYENSQSISLPKATVEGHFSKSNSEGLVFEPTYSLAFGRRPLNYQEIVLSDELCHRLNLSDPINKSVYFTFPVVEDYLPSGYISRDFKTVSLKVVGVSKSGKLSLNHDEGWSILFFQTMLGISSLELNVENLAIKIDKNHESSVISKLSRAFPNYEVYSPLKDVRDSIDQICHYIELILLIVSVTSVLIASLILIICNYLHYMEAKKDIGLVRCLGSKKSESKKFVYYHSFLMTGLSLVLSTIELLIVSFFLSKAFSESLGISSQFVFEPKSILYMLLVSLFISLVSSFFISLRITKMEPLDCLR